MARKGRKGVGKKRMMSKRVDYEGAHVIPIYHSSIMLR